MLKIIGYGALIALGLGFYVLTTAANKDGAEDALRAAGYSEQAISTMKLEIFAVCMKGRQGYIITTENQGRVKVCVGGFNKPAISVVGS